MSSKLRSFITSKYFLAFLSSILFLLTLPPFRQSWIAGIALVPLLLLIDKERSFWKNFLFGISVVLPYAVYGLYWSLYYNVWNYFDVLISYLPFFGLFSALTGLFLKKFPDNILIHSLVPGIIWVSLSFLYDQTPISGVGTQALFYQSLEWMQSARVFGVYGIMFLFLMLNASIALALEFRSKKRFIPLALSVFLLIMNFFWGRQALADTSSGTQKVALIQHNFPIHEEWGLENWQFVLSRYRSMALEAAKEKPVLMVFPSYLLSFDAYREPHFFEELAQETGSYLLVTTYIPKVANQPIAEVGQYEVALLFSPKAKLVGMDRAVEGPAFRKIHQVFANETQVLPTPLGKIGILLCIEDTLPRRASEEVQKGAEILVAISNIGFFTKTFLPKYHLYQDQLRAIETGKFVIRVSANGYSAIIDPRGRILARTELGKRQILYGYVPEAKINSKVN